MVWSKEKEGKWLNRRAKAYMEMMDADEEHEFKKVMAHLKKIHGLSKLDDDIANKKLQEKIIKVGPVKWLKGVFGYGFSKGHSYGVDFITQKLRWIEGKPIFDGAYHDSGGEDGR